MICDSFVVFVLRSQVHFRPEISMRLLEVVVGGRLLQQQELQTLQDQRRVSAHGGSSSSPPPRLSDEATEMLWELGRRRAELGDTQGASSAWHALQTELAQTREQMSRCLSHGGGDDPEYHGRRSSLSSENHEGEALTDLARRMAVVEVKLSQVGAALRSFAVENEDMAFADSVAGTSDAVVSVEQEVGLIVNSRARSDDPPQSGPCNWTCVVAALAPVACGMAAAVALQKRG